MKARTAAANQLRSLIDTAPERVRAQLRDLTFKKKIALAARWRRTRTATPDGASRYALASVARRWQALATEIGELGRHIKRSSTTSPPRSSRCTASACRTAAA